MKKLHPSITMARLRKIMKSDDFNKIHITSSKTLNGYWIDTIDGESVVITTNRGGYTKGLTEHTYNLIMNITRFTTGKRYVRNDGKDSYLVVDERITASGYWYITLRSDMTGGIMERKVKRDDNVEWVDLLGGVVKGTTKDSDWALTANSITSYISMTENETKLIDADEAPIKMTVKELKAMIGKDMLNDNDCVLIKRV